MKGRSPARWLGLAIIVAYGSYFGARRILGRVFAPPLREGAATPRDLGLVGEQVWLSSVNGTRLHGWFIPTGRKAPAVIVLHGWGGNAASMLPLAPHLHRAGFHSFFLDARNHGLSASDDFTSMPRFAEDLEAAADWLIAHPDVSSLGVIGHSVGAGAAILSASRTDKIGAVVSVAAPAHPGEMMHEQMARIPKPARTLILAAIQRIIGYRFDEFAPRHRIAFVTAPTMLVHGAADQIVSVGNTYELAAAQPNAEVLVVPGAGHTDIDLFVHHVGDITDFLDRHLRE